MSQSLIVLLLLLVASESEKVSGFSHLYTDDFPFLQVDCYAKGLVQHQINSVPSLGFNFLLCQVTIEEDKSSEKWIKV